MAKASALLKAYLNSEIPLDGGFIISSFFDNSSTYSIYEVTAYKTLRIFFNHRKD
jgi:hypothetical protein